MKLAIVSDRKGGVLAAAVCRAHFGDDGSSWTDVAIEGRAVQPGVSRSARANSAGEVRSHMVDAPAFMDGLKADELPGALEKIHREMRLRVTQGRPELVEGPASGGEARWLGLAHLLLAAAIVLVLAALGYYFLT